jgi:hypothetical protein
MSVIRSQDRIADLTMLPISPEARAQMKIVLGHAALLPDSSSFEVLDN